MKLPVTIDPRYHDAVVFGLDGALIDDASLFEATVALARKCHGSGVATAAHALGPHCQDVLKAAGVDDLFDVYIDSLEAVRRLGVSPQRAVVVEYTGAGVSAGQDGGFALVIGVDRTGHADTLLRRGADVVLADLADIAVRAGDKRISEPAASGCWRAARKNLAGPLVGGRLVDELGKGVHGLPVDEYVELGELSGAVADNVVVEAGVAAARRFELIVELEEDFGQRHLEAELHPLFVEVGEGGLIAPLSMQRVIRLPI